MLSLLEKCPLATKVVQNWFTEVMLSSMSENTPKEVKEYMKEAGIPLDSMAELIEMNPRVLFDVLDENEVYVEICIHPDSKQFSYKIFGQSIEDWFPDRKTAEREAMMDAIQVFNLLLENEGQDSGTGEGEVSPTE